MVSALRNTVSIATDDQGPSALVSGGEERKSPARMFARVTSRRAREVIVGAAAAGVTAALWLTGAWMTSNVARALDVANRAEVSRNASEPEHTLVIGAATGQRQDERAALTWP